jgi:hypothetical protein
MREITTVKISTETKDRLNKLKEYSKESYDEILKKILFVLNTCRKNPEKAQRMLFGIDSRIKKRQAYNKQENPKENKNNH